MAQALNFKQGSKKEVADWNDFVPKKVGTVKQPIRYIIVLDFEVSDALLQFWW